MKKYFLILLILISCTQDVTQNEESSNVLITETSFQYINIDLKQDYENFTNKKTIIVFWADY
ncbi:MAG: hypothetical protein ACJ0GE_00515 [Candidatus Actinomarina sp.]